MLRVPELGCAGSVRARPPAGDGTPGVLLVDIEADLVIRDSAQVVFTEGLFPVAELAPALVGWLHRPDGERGDFEFDWMSYAELGAVRIVRSGEVWRVGSGRSARRVVGGRR